MAHVTAQTIQNYLRSRNGGWVDLERTVDTFKAGDPDVALTGIAVAWMGYLSVLQRAVDLGCNLLVTHEPIYYNHVDKIEPDSDRPAIAAKRRFLEESGLTILRCHDLWDQLQGDGIPDSWARTLGFSEPVVSESFYRVFDLGERSALDVARHVARMVAPLGQDRVQLVGPHDSVVRRVVIGTGAITPFFHLIQTYGADLVICTDDGFTFWRDGAYAIDASIPVIVVNHAVSELAGIEALAGVLQTAFPQVPVHYIEERCMFTSVAGGED